MRVREHRIEELKRQLKGIIVKKIIGIILSAVLAVSLSGAPALAHGDTRLHRVARCESGFGGEHKPRTNTGNGYYGAYQFSLRSWRWVGGKGYPHHASLRRQTRLACRLRDRQGGANAWPYCWPNHYRYRYI